MSGVEPHFVVAGMAALWLLSKGAKLVLDWWLGIVRNRLLIQKEREKEKASEQISVMEDSIKGDYSQRIKKLQHSFEGSRKEIMAGLREAYGKLLIEHGYSKRG